MVHGGKELLQKKEETEKIVMINFKLLVVVVMVILLEIEHCINTCVLFILQNASTHS